VALGASAARGTGLGSQDRAEFLLLASPGRVFPCSGSRSEKLFGIATQADPWFNPAGSSVTIVIFQRVLQQEQQHLQQRQQQQEQQQHSQERQQQQKQQRQSPWGPLLAQLAEHPRKQVLFGGFACHLLADCGNFSLHVNV
jgi:hypothetical protein